MSRPKPLAPIGLDTLRERFPAYRQSILSAADNCLLSVRFDLEGGDHTNAAQARGIIFHRFAAEYLRTLWRSGETAMPSEEAMVILYEVSRQRDVPPSEIVVVPARERRLLRMAALALAGMPLDMTRLIDVERKLEAPIEYDHPKHGRVRRMISGTPDALLADPPAGAIVLDWKTSLAAPAPVPDDYDARPDGDHLHVSPEGYFQQRDYAFLVMANYPAIDRVTLREYYPLVKESRNATVTRGALEHVEHELAVLVEILDRAIMEGSRSEAWAPSPGLH